MTPDRRTTLLNYYNRLLDNLGPSHWWPGETPFEVAIGTILTQNTNWQNVEKAIWNLQIHDLLTPEKMINLSMEELSEFIRPAGYFRIKASRLMNFLHFLRAECGYNLDELAEQDMDFVREKLLSVKGIGPETADSILLYVLKKPSFVVDGYTRRIFNRHALVEEDISYGELRDFFMDVLPPDVQLFNEYHALIVRAGKSWCKKSRPLCSRCPLEYYFA